MTTSSKRITVLILLFLLAVAAVALVWGAPLAHAETLGSAATFQFIPGAVFGAGAILFLYFGEMLPNAVTQNVPVYGSVGVILTVVLSLLSGNQSNIFQRFEYWGFCALFIPAEFNPNDLEFSPYAPYAGHIVSMLIGVFAALIVLAVFRTVKEKQITALFRFNAGAVIALCLPLFIGFVENLIQRQYTYFANHRWELGSTMGFASYLTIFAVYLLFGILLGLFSARRDVHISRAVSIPVIVLALLLWCIVAWGLMFTYDPTWLAYVHTFSRETAGVYFGFIAGIALRTAIAKKTAT